jgi:hypothetical protein
MKITFALAIFFILLVQMNLRKKKSRKLSKSKSKTKGWVEKPATLGQHINEEFTAFRYKLNLVEGSGNKKVESMEFEFHENPRWTVGSSVYYYTINREVKQWATIIGVTENNTNVGGRTWTVQVDRIRQNPKDSRKL